MDVSFIILAWNAEAYLERCVNSIGEALAEGPFRYEVLVLDNGSHDSTGALLQEFALNDPLHIRAHAVPTNLGTTRSRNFLCQQAAGAYLCVMDSDVELRKGVLETLVSVLEQDRRHGVVVPRIEYPSGTWQKSFDRFPTPFDKVNRFFRLREIERREGERLRNASEPFFVDYAISAFWLMRRRLLDDVGPLDERIFYAPEDVDFCLRVWQAGYRIVYVPAATIVHHTQEISRGFKLNRAKLEHIKGLSYFYRKHRYLFRRPSFPAAAD